MSAEVADPMVTAEWLREHLAAPDVRVIEATWYMPGPGNDGRGAREYDDGHIPGAVFFDIDRVADRETDLPHMLPGPVPFSSAVRKLGLGDGHRLVVYDRNRLCAAARVWWMFRAMGHEDVFVLDGGLDAWQAAGGELEDMAPTHMERHFTPRVRANLVKTLDQMEALVEAGQARILDARPAGRFDGTQPEPREGLPSGHMPGAENIPAGSVLQADGRLKSKDALAELFGDTSQPIVTSCGSGVSAAHLALALARLGRDDVAIYDGSWTEWAAGDRPIETAAA